MTEQTISKKILIGEDEKPLAKALKLKLEKAGFDVVVAFNGEEALSVLEKDKFDLVLLDLVMPVMNGFKVLEEMKKRNMNTPVVVTSNLSQEEDIKKAKELGAKDYFVKSDVAIAQVVEYVKKVI